MRARFAMALSIFLVSQSHADEPLGSAHTRLDFGQCEIAPGAGAIERHGLVFTHWICPGFEGVPVHVGEGDAHFLMSFGAKGGRERAFNQTFVSKNRIDAELEWRYEQTSAGRRPFAVIQTWETRDSLKGNGRVVVVTSLPPRQVCQVAIVDALANLNAMDLARQSADAMARGFECAFQDPLWVALRSTQAPDTLE